jgi:transcriptional regulator with XRE-family HTH domain
MSAPLKKELQNPRTPTRTPTSLSRLQQEISRHGVTQERMAIDLHLHPSYMSLICTGKRVPSIETGKRIADYLGVSLDRWWEILRGRGTGKGVGTGKGGRGR